MSTTFSVVRDLLDKKLLDKDNCDMGRVDGVVLEMPQGRQPRLVRIELGGEILAIRVARWLVRPTRWLRKSFGPKRSAHVKIEWKHVKRMGRDIHLDIPADDTEALAWEHWMAQHVVARIPGGTSK
jgi:sporulation protein YlmC with PRC-barrel domain